MRNCNCGESHARSERMFFLNSAINLITETLWDLQERAPRIELTDELVDRYVRVVLKQVLPRSEQYLIREVCPGLIRASFASAGGRIEIIENAIRQTKQLPF